MLRDEAKFYRVRSETDQHKSFFRNINKRTGSILKLIERTFKHHCAVFSNSIPMYLSIPTTDTGKIERIINDEYIGTRFYQEYFVDPQIFIGISKKSATISEDGFVNEILSHPDDPTKNKIKFLLGEVGSGKTAFVNNLITNRAHNWLKNRKVWFIRIDAHLSGSGLSMSYGELIDALIRKTIRVTISSWNQLKLPKKFPPYTNLHRYRKNKTSKELALSNFFKEVYEKTGLRPFLIFDNLDQIYHENDRERFLRDLKIRDDTIKSIIELIACFFQDKSSLGRINANVLFVLREETYDAVRRLERLFTPHKIFKDNQNAYNIGTPDWHDVIENRTRLLRVIAEDYIGKGKRDDVDKVVNPILNKLKIKTTSNDFSLVDHLIALNNYGLRGLVEFFARYAWIYPDQNSNDSIIARYLSHYPLGLLAFMLNGLRRYSQSRSLFPNIYLIDIPEKEYPHSYWLKRLLVEYIWTKEKKNEEVRLDSILSAFCNVESKV